MRQPQRSGSTRPRDAAGIRPFRRASAIASSSSGAAPMRCMPVSTLRWTDRSGPSAAANASTPATDATVNRTRSPQCSAASATKPGASSDRMRTGTSPWGALGDLESFWNRGHSQPGGAASQGGASRGRRAVPVAVSLDHSAQGRAAGPLDQTAGRCPRSPLAALAPRWVTGWQCSRRDLHDDLTRCAQRGQGHGADLTTGFTNHGVTTDRALRRSLATRRAPRIAVAARP